MNLEQYKEASIILSYLHPFEDEKQHIERIIDDLNNKTKDNVSIIIHYPGIDYADISVKKESVLKILQERSTELDIEIQKLIANLESL